MPTFIALLSVAGFVWFVVNQIKKSKARRAAAVPSTSTPGTGPKDYDERNDRR